MPACIDLLPALPAAWPSGAVRGVRARGGFELDVAWEAHVVRRVVLRSRLGGVARLRSAVPLRRDGGALTSATAPNPFYVTHPVTPPIVAPLVASRPAPLAPPVLGPYVVDVETTAGGDVVLERA